MRNPGLKLPFFLLFIFAIIFHPSLRIYLLEFSNPWMYFLISPQMFFLSSSFLVLSVNKMNLKDVGFTTEHLKNNSLLGLGLGAACYLFFATINYIMGKFSIQPELTQPFVWTNYLLFSYFILAPISEELFFRGIIFQGMRGSYSLTISILASALLFAASHSSMMVGPFALGIIAALLTEKTKSIVPAILFHAISNGLPWFYLNHCTNLHALEKWIFFRF